MGDLYLLDVDRGPVMRCMNTRGYVLARDFLNNGDFHSVCFVQHPGGIKRNEVGSFDNLVRNEAHKAGYLTIPLLHHCGDPVYTYLNQTFDLLLERLGDRLRLDDRNEKFTLRDV